MLDITRLCGSLLTRGGRQSGRTGTQLELVPAASSRADRGEAGLRPVVTWRVTRSCNLNCLSCVSDSRPRHHGLELTTSDAKALIRDLAEYEVPRLVFAGGEPLLRTDLPELVACAQDVGIATTLFSNGTLLTPARAPGIGSSPREE